MGAVSPHDSLASQSPTGGSGADDPREAIIAKLEKQLAAEHQARLNAEAELASSLRLASMGALAGSIVHEINQPLAAIATSAGACRRWIAAGPQRTDRALASLDRVISESERASAVVAGLKSLIRDSSPTIAPLDSEEAMREVASLVMSELARERVLLETDFAPNLPAVLGDKVQVQQVVMNLIRNAIDAMRTVTHRRVLGIGAAPMGDEVVLFVADNGVGIAPERVCKLFDAPYTTKPGGLGIGLAISRRIVAAHRGRLWVDTREREGATFRLSLPVAPADGP
jgi:two-component system, LuxR family, sensor kinase FixL